MSDFGFTQSPMGGGSGFVGKALVNHFTRNGVTPLVVRRWPSKGELSWKDIERNGIPSDVTAVVNVAGENILNPFKRWNAEFKKIVRSSRIDTTKLLANAIKAAEKPPECFVTMSGVAYYKPDLKRTYTEDDKVEPYDFLSQLTHDWEAAGELPEELGVRRVIIRSGVILGREGGMVREIYPIFWLGLGGRLGPGNQVFPWIHIEDVRGIFLMAVKNSAVTGVLNAVAPCRAGWPTNLDFTKAFGKYMKRPTIFPVPGFSVNLLFGNERGKVMLEGQKVVPHRTLMYGYEFECSDIDMCCEELARSRVY